MARKIDVNAVIYSVRLKEVSDPSTPGSGYAKIYAKTTGAHFIGDDGIVHLLSARQVILTVEGQLSVGANPLKIPNILGLPLFISQVYLIVDTAPTGAAIIVDVHKDGVTIFTVQANRPQIAAAAYSGNTTTIDDDEWANGEYLTMEIDQVGSTIAGSDLTVVIVTG